MNQKETWAEAEAIRKTRNDWHELPIVKCACGQRFYAEVIGQTECRDCLSCASAGPYEGGK